MLGHVGNVLHTYNAFADMLMADTALPQSSWGGILLLRPCPCIILITRAMLCVVSNVQAVKIAAIGVLCADST